MSNGQCDKSILGTGTGTVGNVMFLEVDIVGYFLLARVTTFHHCTQTVVVAVVIQKQAPALLKVPRYLYVRVEK